MAIMENGLKGNIMTGLAIGIGAAVLAPVVIPIIASVAKPLAKAAIKGGIQLYERGKETFAEVSEVMEDLVAEAKAEFEQPAAAAAAAVTPGETGQS
jgi:galactitol-specific phosphotransferase system IIC component